MWGPNCPSLDHARPILRCKSIRLALPDKSALHEYTFQLAADRHIPPPNELPSYQDSKYNDSHTVEVSAYQEPLAFPPHRMQGAGVNEPAEMDAGVSVKWEGV